MYLIIYTDGYNSHGAEFADFGEAVKELLRWTKISEGENWMGKFYKDGNLILRTTPPSKMWRKVETK